MCCALSGMNAGEGTRRPAATQFRIGNVRHHRWPSRNMASVDVGDANGSSLHHHDFKLARQQVQNGLDPYLATSWKSNTLMASAALAMASGAYGSVGFCARIDGAAQTAGLLARKRRKALLEASVEAESVVIFSSRDYAGGPGGNRACRAVPVSACKRSGPESGLPSASS